MADVQYEVFGGELVDVTKTEFKDPTSVHKVGKFDSYEEAYDAWKANAWATVDNALMRYFIKTA